MLPKYLSIQHAITIAVLSCAIILFLSLGTFTATTTPHADTDVTANVYLNNFYNYTWLVLIAILPVRLLPVGILQETIVEHIQAPAVTLVLVSIVAIGLAMWKHSSSFRSRSW